MWHLIIWRQNIWHKDNKTDKLAPRKEVEDWLCWCQISLLPNTKLLLGAAFFQEPRIHCWHKGRSNHSIVNVTGLYLFDSDTIPLCLNPIWSVQFLPLASAFMQVKYQFEHTRILQNLKICKYWILFRFVVSGRVLLWWDAHVPVCAEYLKCGLNL